MTPNAVRSKLYLAPLGQRAEVTRLLVRPARTTYQCRQDHLMQIAETNAFSSLRNLLQNCNVSFATLMALSDDELQLFLEGKLKEGKLKLRHRKMVSVAYVKAFGRGTPGRICLVCMKNGMVVPHYFNYSLSLICPIHDTTLLDVCDGCEAPILYTRMHRLRCGKCRRDFRESAAKR